MFWQFLYILDSLPSCGKMGIFSIFGHRVTVLCRLLKAESIHRDHYPSYFVVVVVVVSVSWCRHLLYLHLLRNCLSDSNQTFRISCLWGLVVHLQSWKYQPDRQSVTNNFLAGLANIQQILTDYSGGSRGGPEGPGPPPYVEKFG